MPRTSYCHMKVQTIPDCVPSRNFPLTTVMWRMVSELTAGCSRHQQVVVAALMEEKAHSRCWPVLVPIRGDLFLEGPFGAVDQQQLLNRLIPLDLST